MSDPVSQFDGERHARRLVPAGALCMVVALLISGWGGTILAIVAAVLLLLACHSHPDGLIVLGPFARAELVRLSRSQRLWRKRMFYALGVGALAFLCLLPAYDSQSGSIDSELLPRLGERLFVVFSIGQFVYLTHLSVNYFSSVVAEEREARRWDFLLVSDLRAREILFGKAVGRLPNLLDPLLVSFPILAFLPFLGGVSPSLVWAVLHATGATIIGVAGIACFASVLSSSAHQAREYTKSLIVLYMLFSFGLYLCSLSNDLWTFPVSVGINSPVRVDSLVRLANVGNPIMAYLNAYRGVMPTTGLFEDRIAIAVQRYAAFHLVVFFLFGMMAVVRLRRFHASQGQANTKLLAYQSEMKAVAARHRPPVSDWPLIWWEHYGGQSYANRWIWTLNKRRYYLVLLLVSLCFFGLRHIFNDVSIYGIQAIPSMKSCRVGVSIVLYMSACAFILSATGRSARTIARERRMRTLDELRLTALTSRDIVQQKWLGAVTAEYPFFIGLLIVGFAAVITGFVSLIGIVGLAVATMVYTGCMAAVAISFSARAQTPNDANRNVTLFFVIVGVLLLVTVIWVSPTDGIRTGLFSFLLPPVTLAMPLLSRVEDIPPDIYRAALFGSLAGLILYAWLGWMAIEMAIRWFDSGYENDRMLSNSRESS